MTTVLESFDASVAKAIEDGTLDATKQGALIEAARKIAAVFDAPGWPLVKGRFDNVSPSIFLKYCAALGIVPDPKAKPKAQTSTRLEELMKGSRFAKTFNNVNNSWVDDENEAL